MKYYSDNTWVPYIDSVQVVYSGANQKVYLPKLPRGSVLEIKTISIFAFSLHHWQLTVPPCFSWNPTELESHLTLYL